MQMFIIDTGRKSRPCWYGSGEKSEHSKCRGATGVEWVRGGAGCHTGGRHGRHEM